MRHRKAGKAAAAALAIAVVAAGAQGAAATPKAGGHQFFGLTKSQELVTFAASKPQAAKRVGAITGLGAGETLVGFDARPRTGDLYGVSDASKLYTIDEATGAATLVAPISVPLAGTEFGVDFNPAADRLRVISDADQSLRIHPDTGVAISDGSLEHAPTDANAGADPNAVGAAYTNNDNDPATGTQLFDIDSTLDTLVLQNPPNDGVLTTIGSLGTDTFDRVGFDIVTSGTTNTAYASLGKGGTEKLYRIDLATGQATFIAPFGATEIADIAADLD